MPDTATAAQRAIKALTPAQHAIAALVEMVAEASHEPDAEVLDVLASVARRALTDALSELDGRPRAEMPSLKALFGEIARAGATVAAARGVA